MRWKAIWIILLFLLITLIWGAGGYAVWSYFDFDVAKSGPWGDTFGAINSLFTGLAFAGVVVTIIFQFQEMAHARADAALQEKAQEEQARILRDTAKLNALIALAQHAGKSYERAVELELPEARRQTNAEEYDRHIARLRAFVEQAAADTAGFGFLSMEKEAVSLPFLDIAVESAGMVQASGSFDTRKTQFQLRLRLTNRTDANLTLVRVDAFLRGHDSRQIVMPFAEAADKTIQPRGSIVVAAEATGTEADQQQLPKVGFVVTRVAQQPGQSETVLDPAIAATFR